MNTFIIDHIAICHDCKKVGFCVKLQDSRCYCHICARKFGFAPKFTLTENAPIIEIDFKDQSMQKLPKTFELINGIAVFRTDIKMEKLDDEISEFICDEYGIYPRRKDKNVTKNYEY